MLPISLDIRPSGGAYHPEGYQEGQTIMMDGMSMDADYIPLLGIEMVAGRNFSLEHPVDPENSVLINETAAKEIGWDDPVGKMISMPGSIEDKMVIGVIKDFHYQYPQKPIRPLYIGNGNDASKVSGNLYQRSAQRDITKYHCLFGK